ncbi:Rqc2 family fibronectin-binding protein [Bacillus horti]|uniref:Rqc2 homolog RqcH n=1 Tax=Caldalkalibacillus horti TaxID=77523 RepID=A0ABT9VYK0_9BACI|nr:NFACT RNA binding domain-containing protein [Bacillus horti]MDQ0165690.1 putative ribosome quality control (RQC) complex YloA/Tae2 family protein [Bacillus horti]
MAFDGMMVYGIVDELQQLEHGRISKIYQPYDRDLVFHIRANGRNVRLLLSANPSYPRIHLTEQSFENPMEAPMFCMLLRKHLEGGIIQRVEQINMERIIHIDVRSRDELGETTYKRLIIEIMGRHSNIILIDVERNMILDSIHHVTGAISQHRVVLPGRTYVSPPDQFKQHPFEATADDVVKKLNFNAGKLDQQLVQQFSGISPLLAKEVLFRAGLPNRESVTQSFLDLMNSIKKKEFSPSLINSSDKVHFYLIELKHIKGGVVPFPTISKLLEAFYHGKAERDQVKQRANDFAKFISNEMKKNEKKLTKLQQTLDNSLKADTYKLHGELLTAYMHQAKRGDTSIQVINYYDEKGETLDIPLNPELTPNENAQQFFKLYQKAKNSKEAVIQQIELTNQELRYFEELIQQLEHASPRDVEEIREELIEGGYIRDRRKQKKKKKKDEKPQLDQYQSSEGVEILVGKNNKQNEYLTNRLARPNETWLHTKDIPGSHVVIRSEQITDQTLLEAAQLAAYYSKARSSSQVPVDYTLIRHVKKPNGSKPGYVIYDNQQTVYVTPVEEQVNALKK